MSQPQISPVMLLRSFLTVGSGYILSIMTFIAIMFGLGYAFFPDFVAVMNLDPAVRDDVMANNPKQAISSQMFWLVVGLNALAGLGIGWYVIKTAPFARFPHAVFLTVLLFIYFLQMLIEDPPAKKSMTLVYMIVFPLAVIIGAKWAHGKTLARDASEPVVDEAD